MKIDCDNLALRLSASSPMDNKFYSKHLHDLSSPSTRSEPPLSSPSSNDQQKLSSWLNTINTITTTTSEGADGRMRSIFSSSFFSSSLFFSCRISDYFTINVQKVQLVYPNVILKDIISCLKIAVNRKQSIYYIGKFIKRMIRANV